MKEAIKHTAAKMKGGFYTGVGLGAGLLTSGLFAAAAAMNIFSAGEVISAAKINQNFAIAAPEGAIMAFNLPNCPEGWAPADGTNGTPDLRGEFIRGRDDIGTGPAGHDPDGPRAVASLQLDAFQGHWHSSNATTLVSGPSIGSGSMYQGGTASVGDPVTDGAHGNPRVAAETRPRNVALTYCMRKN